MTTSHEISVSVGNEFRRSKSFRSRREACNSLSIRLKFVDKEVLPSDGGFPRFNVYVKYCHSHLGKVRKGIMAPLGTPHSHFPAELESEVLTFMEEEYLKR
ncbi:hypothetical protein P5641_19470 [Bacillus subtilis]|nr:hypothetical protein [Bacillus subtilis]MED3696244.1 hypothetical protein [Bacillus subtilis]OTQ87258.1 hypothetical protein BG30_05500 [Bacillus subtilis subsp. subtilis]WEY95795.1 hypothetical protein P5641_19470 [Bacillus subtilis]